MVIETLWVITILIALYWVVVGALYCLRPRPKLRFTVRSGMVKIRSNDKGTFIQTEVTNYGDRPTTLEAIGFRYFERPWSWARLRNCVTEAARLNDLNAAQPFPYELEPGSVWRGLTPQDPEIDNWIKKGALYFDLWHSHSAKPLQKRLRY